MEVEQPNYHSLGKLNYKIFQLVKDFLSVFKPVGQPLVPVNLADMGNLADAAVLFVNSGQDYSVSSDNFIMVLLQVLFYLILSLVLLVPSL